MSDDKNIPKSSDASANTSSGNASNPESGNATGSTAAGATNSTNKKKTKLPKETPQRGLFKKKRGGVVLTKEQVREIKAGRKKLKKQMKREKVYTRKDFELTASSMGLYFDKYKRRGLLLWFLSGKWLPLLLAAAALLMLTLFIFSKVTALRGHFTINLGEELFLRGFSLSEDEAFTNPTSQLDQEPVQDVPCVSIVSIPSNINDGEGKQDTRSYFAYTFFLRYESQEELDANYAYKLVINSESKELSKATWIMLFYNDEMTFYAKPREDGGVEALPAIGDVTKGYRDLPLMMQTADQTQYEVIDNTSSNNVYYRVLPKNFETSRQITSGIYQGMKPGEIHKFTVVIWLEGDDPDCTNALIGGHLGVEMQFELLDSEEEEEKPGSFFDRIEAIWESLNPFD